MSHEHSALEPIACPFCEASCETMQDDPAVVYAPTDKTVVAPLTEVEFELYRCPTCKAPLAVHVLDHQFGGTLFIADRYPL